MLEMDRKPVRFNWIDDVEMPPITITMDSEDNPQVHINRSHRIWLSLNRKLIAGISEELFGKIDELLNAHLQEQRMFEKMEE